MNEKWSNKWKNCLIWFSAYMSFIAFALVGGFVIIKTDDKELQKTTKQAFIVSLIFAAISGILTIYYNFMSMADVSYNSFAYDLYNLLGNMLNISKVVVFGVFILLALFNKKEEQVNE